MTLTRRSVLALALTPILYACRFSSKPKIPKLVGDGIADDTVALQALIDESVRHGRLVEIPRGCYRITAPIDTTRCRSGSVVCGSTWILSGAACIVLGEGVNFQHNLITGFVRIDEGPQIGDVTVRAV